MGACYLSKAFVRKSRTLSIAKKYQQIGTFFLAAPHLGFLASLKVRKRSRKVMQISFKNLLTAACSLALSGSALAQLEMSKKNSFDVGKPAFDNLQSPNVPTGNSKKSSPKDWLECEVKIKVNKLGVEPKDKYLDQFKVNWYVVVKGQDGKGYLMTKTITHVNLPIDEEAYVSVYLSPNSLRRITGNARAGKSDLEAIGGEIEYAGEMVGFFSHGERAGWWRKELKNIERTEKFPLLDKSQTPFAPFWYDRYAELLPKNGN